MEFKAVGENAISVRAWHYEAYDKKEPLFEKHTENVPYTVEIDDQKAVMTVGEVSVIVDRKNWGYRFVAGGQVLTSCGLQKSGICPVGRHTVDTSAVRALYVP